MYSTLSLFTGLIISVMLALNGKLTLQYENINATLIVHVVGVLFGLVLCLFRAKNVILKKDLPLWLYLGGAIGLLTTVFTNFAYGKISLTSIIALGLLGQAIASLLIDSLGLFGMKKHEFKLSSLIGLAFSFFGMVIMLDNPTNLAFYAVMLSFLSGITVILSRTVNARLSQHIGELESSLINHLVGLVFIVGGLISIWVIFKRNLLIPIITEFSPNPWMYMGGILGISTVVLSNITVPKIPAFRLTLLTFVGQVFTGLAIDLFSKGVYSDRTFVGGVLVAIGVAANILYEQVVRRRKEYHEQV